MKKERSTAIPDYQATTPQAFKKQLGNFSNAYLELKDAFVKTDAASANQVAGKVVSQLEKIDGNLLKGEAHDYWMEQIKTLKIASEKIKSLNEVEAQRKQFGLLSNALIQSIQAFGAAGEILYVQHCPMAFNNEGGDWIAAEETIQNPYFGDKMMKCGLVKKDLSVNQE